MIKIEVSLNSDGSVCSHHEIKGMRAIVDFEISELARTLIYNMCIDENENSAIEVYDCVKDSLMEGVRLGLADYFKKTLQI